MECFPAPCHPLGWVLPSGLCVTLWAVRHPLGWASGALEEYIAVLALKEDTGLGCRGEPGVQTDH